MRKKAQLLETYRHGLSSGVYRPGFCDAFVIHLWARCKKTMDKSGGCCMVNVAVWPLGRSITAHTVINAMAMPRPGENHHGWRVYRRPYLDGLKKLVENFLDGVA